MPIAREQIIDALRDAFVEDPAVLAMWLEGSSAHPERLDALSDIDVVVDVKDGEEEAIFARAGQALLSLGPLDLAADLPLRHPHLRHRVFHLSGSSEFLVIDFVVQSHSRNFRFVRENTFERPLVLFDKADVLMPENLDQAAFAREAHDRLGELRTTWRLRTGVSKYVARGRFLEALAYYHRYVLAPLIELLRLEHTPLIRDHYLVHISDQLPEATVRELEELHRVGSTREIAAKLERATALFERTLAEVERRYT